MGSVLSSIGSFLSSIGAVLSSMGSVLSSIGSFLSSIGAVLSSMGADRSSPSPPPLPFSSPSPSSPRPAIKHEVFLSFRGEDIRSNFLSHLREAFDRNRIYAFIDNQLERGQEISPALLQAIKESQISVVIFSETYADSTWCLEELVKILECKQKNGQIVIPVFYQINPSDVRKQTGSYAVAFEKHKDRFKEDLDKVQKWRDDLREAANISGFASSDVKDEAALVEKIVGDVLKKLSNMPSSENDTPSSDNMQQVGMESKITKIEEMLRMGIQMNLVHKVGICGIGGIGKTTLAKAVFDKICYQFPEGRFFFDSVRKASETNQQDLLKQLDPKGVGNAYSYDPSIKRKLRNKKLLIVFDDVTDFLQINGLIGDLDCDLESGSRIIITSRDRQVLRNCQVNENDIYMVEELHFDDSLKLFNWHAFKPNPPAADYMELSKAVVKKVRGVPLALMVLGSYLLRRRKEFWELLLEMLENDLSKLSEERIHKVLKISYDGLESCYKKIFLDIACFYKGWDVDRVKAIEKNFFFDIALSDLENKCLIIRLDNKLMMHDLLEAMGKKIVREQSADERTRLWHHEDIYDVLTNATGTEKIEGISLDVTYIKDITLHVNAFKEMSKLKFLRIWRVWNNQVHVLLDLKFDLHELRYLEWEGYPLKSLQYLKNLVILNLFRSNVEQLWSGVQQFDHLKEMQLEASRNLTSFPNIHAPKLEVLNLGRCKSLIEMPSSFQDLTQLTDLIIPSCPKLTSVPELPVNLTALDLRQCSSLIELPLSVQRLTKLESLDLWYCRSLTSIPDCTGLISLGSACQFKGLDLQRPHRRGSLPKYDGLRLEYCSNLQRLPELPNNLVGISLIGCSSLIEIPSSIQQLTSLQYVCLSNCTSLTSMTDCSGLMSLKQLALNGCSKLERFPDLPNDLSFLSFDGCTSLLKIPSSFQHLCKLVTLSFGRCKSLTSIPDLTGLQSLKSLFIRSCSKLQRLPELPNSIMLLHLEKIPIEELPPSYEHLCTLRALWLTDCSRLKSLPSIFCAWKSLNTLYLKNCPTACALSISRYGDGVAGSLSPPIDFLHKLMILSLSGCGMTEIPDSVCCLTSLNTLELDRNNFERIPESIINLSKLSDLNISYCNFERIPESIINLSKLSYLNISYCERLKVLPRLSWARIDALNCTSLQELSCPSFPNYPVSVVDTPCVLVNFINCFKLDQNSLDSFVKDTQLEIQAKSPSNVMVRGWADPTFAWREDPTLAICYPGSEIPKQFTFQCSRSSIDVKLPPDYNFLCVALCAVVSFPDQCDAHSKRNLSVNYKYDVKSKKGDFLSMHGFLFRKNNSLDDNVRSSHVFIGFGIYFVHQTHDDELTFEFYSSEEDCKVEKCGVHLIFSAHLEVSEEEEDESYGEESEEEDNRMNRMVKNPRRRRKPINLY